MDLYCFCSVLCLLCRCKCLFICAFWSPAGKGLTSWLSFVVSNCNCHFPIWYPGSGVVLDCIDSWSLHTYLLYSSRCDMLNKDYLLTYLLTYLLFPQNKCHVGYVYHFINIKTGWSYIAQLCLPYSQMNSMHVRHHNLFKKKWNSYRPYSSSLKTFTVKLVQNDSQGVVYLSFHLPSVKEWC